jgi:uncharacterized membrane protein YjfL (UPF0719 family)
MVDEKFLIEIFIAILQLFVGFAFSIAAVYVGISLLDRLTRGTNEWDRIKKGNMAVGILYAAVIFSLVIMIQPSILATVNSFNNSGENVMYQFSAHLLILVIALLVAVLSIYILLRIIDMMTVDVDEFKEIHKGNTAMALITGAALVAVSFVVSEIIANLVKVLTITSAISG